MIPHFLTEAVLRNSRRRAANRPAQIQARKEQAFRELDKEYRSIGENWELNRQAWERIQNGAKHVLDWSALGYTLHIVYTAMENYFLRISKVFENNLPRESWHKELLERMQRVYRTLFQRRTNASARQWLNSRYGTIRHEGTL
jgi:hypothetical protein